MKGVTLKEIADNMGFPKQKVYRFVKKMKINHNTMLKGTLYYNTQAQKIIKTHFEAKKQKKKI